MHCLLKQAKMRCNYEDTLSQLRAYSLFSEGEALETREATRQRGSLLSGCGALNVPSIAFAFRIDVL